VTDLSHDTAVDIEGEELERLVLKGLRAPLSPTEAARLDSLVSASADLAARAQTLTRTWMLAGLLQPETTAAFGRDGLDRRWLIGGGVAAAAAAAATVGVWVGDRPTLNVYQAPADGPLRATLADGTRLTLSRGGRLEARMDAGARRVRLLGGEAFFAVTHDARRPFSALVGDHRLTVLGTAFNVDPAADGLRVDLLEGSLRVERAGKSASAAVLKPGERYWAGRSPQVAPSDVAAAAAWVDGRLVFDDASLTQVAADLYRQTGETLTFDSPRLAALRFSGVLQLGKSSVWRSGLAAVLPIQFIPEPRGYRIASAGR
jgi:transmembrane sensor